MRTRQEMSAYQRERRKKLRLKEMEPFGVIDLRDLKCGGCIAKDKEIERLTARIALFESSYGK
jgi:hypothetical protein